MKGTRTARKAYQAFLNDAVRAEEAMRQSGLGYRADDVYRYLEAKVRGGKARRPKTIRWRG
jgi:MFS-type transporter involved in bile tolerance (Atg22 family)